MQASAPIGQETNILTVKALKKWVRAEFEVFQLYLKTILDEKVVAAKGNPFAQGVHDGGTLTSKRKYQAFGIQFVDAKWRRNHVICVGFERCSDGRDVVVADKFRDTLYKNSGHRFDSVVCSVIQDRAAKGVSSHLGLDEEVCGMHDGDKIGQSAVGGLIRTKNKTPINPFPEGQALMKKAHVLGTYFNYTTRHSKLMSFRQQLKDQPELRIQVDLNTTRVAAQHGLLYSELKLNRLLRLYMSVHTDVPQVSDSEWDAMAEIEGILNISKDLTTLMQYEHLYNGAFGQIIKQVTLKRLRAPFVPVIDMPKVTDAKVSHDLRVTYNSC